MSAMGATKVTRTKTSSGATQQKGAQFLPAQRAVEALLQRPAVGGAHDAICRLVGHRDIPEVGQGANALPVGRLSEAYWASQFWKMASTSSWLSAHHSMLFTRKFFWFAGLVGMWGDISMPSVAWVETSGWEEPRAGP